MDEIKPKNQEVKKAKGINNPLLPRLLALKEAAGYLGRTPRAMRGLYWSGKVPIVRDGKKIYFDRQDLDGYILRNKSVYQ